MESSSSSAYGSTSTSRHVSSSDHVPDIILDPDRLNMLLDLICTDYITACYASRENGKKVLVKALQKLYLSVYATTQLEINVKDSHFVEMSRAFYEDLIQDLNERRQEEEALSTTSGTTRLMVDTIVKEILKPKLVQVVEEMCQERDRNLIKASSNSNNFLLERKTSVSHLGPLPPPAFGEIRMEGWLRKKGQHVNLWRERYFMIRSTPHGTHYLCYFRKKGDRDPRGWYILGPGTQVDEVRESTSKIEGKRLFTFRITHYSHATSEDVDDSYLGEATNPGFLAEGQSSDLATPNSTPARFFVGSEMPNSPDIVGANGGTEFDAKASMKRLKARRLRNRAAAAAAAATAATAVVLTGGLAGVGIGMGMGMSAAATAAAAASAGAAGAMMATNRHKGPLALAAESLETAEWWRNSIIECIAHAEDQWKKYLNWYMDKDMSETESSRSVLDSYSNHHSEANRHGNVNQPAHVMTSNLPIGTPPLAPTTLSCSNTLKSNIQGKVPPRLKLGGRQRSGSFGTVPRTIAKTFRTCASFSSLETAWKLYDFTSNLRVYVEKSTSAVKSHSIPAMRTSLRITGASPNQVFDLLMQFSSSFYAMNHVIKEATQLESIDDHSDVIHWRLNSFYLWPFACQERDLCLLRYWRKEQDDSYFICFQSTTHSKAPRSVPSREVIRANVIGGGFIIAPRVHAEGNYAECWVTLTCQLNPKGWIDSTFGHKWYFMHAFGVKFLEMIGCLDGAVKGLQKNPLRLQMDSITEQEEKEQAKAKTTTQKVVEDRKAPETSVSLRGSFPPVSEPFRTDLTLQNGLPTKYWSEPKASSFHIRGPQYLSTHEKYPSPDQAFRLIGMEILKGEEPIKHIGLTSLAASLQDTFREEDHPFVFIVNFMIPGPPFLSVILYFTPQDPTFFSQEASSSFTRLCRQFFHGKDDGFRSTRLKMIPFMVQTSHHQAMSVGNVMIPTIIGTKVYQNYFRTQKYLEVDYDLSSSKVASKLVKLLCEHSRDLVIDLAIVIEAQSPMELPERVLGCARFQEIDLRYATPYKPPPPSSSSSSICANNLSKSKTASVALSPHSNQ